MSFTQQYPNTFIGQVTNAVTKRLNNEFIYLYNLLTSLFGASGHAHTGNGSDGKVIAAASIANTPAGNIAAITVQSAINELDTEKVATSSLSTTAAANKIPQGNASNGQLDASFMSGMLIAEQTVEGSAQTSVTFSELDGEVVGGYVLVIEVGNPTGSTASYVLYLNGDTTNSHYQCQDLVWQTTPLASNYAIPYICGGLGAGEMVTGIINLNINSSGMACYSSSMMRTDDYAEIIHGRMIDPIANITSITIQTSIASAIGIGSRFRLYRRL
jgi:hypothetical protein